MQKLFAHTSAITLLFGASALVASAQGQTYQNPITYGGIDSIPALLLAIVDLVFLIGTPIIAIFVIYSGFLFVTAGDNESQLAKAKTTFLWTIIGALILLGAKALAMVLQGTVDALK